VRYISHELRTPLNATSIGLNLVIDELARRNNPVDEELREIIGDVKLAAGTAVDILNGTFYLSTAPSVLYIHLLSHIPASVRAPPPPPPPHLFTSPPPTPPPQPPPQRHTTTTVY